MWWLSLMLKHYHRIFGSVQNQIKLRIGKAMYGLPSGHIQLWEPDCREGRMPKNWCLQTMLLEKTPKSPLDSKEIKPVNLKGNQPWIVTGRTDIEAPVFWSSDVNRWLFGKVPRAGKDWRQKEKRASEDEMAAWHHWYNEHEFGQTVGDGEGQEGLVCCRPWGHKGSGHDWLTGQQQTQTECDGYLWR